MTLRILGSSANRAAAVVIASSDASDWAPKAPIGGGTFHENDHDPGALHRK